MVEVKTKRSELAKILRRLADYIDKHPDEELAPIFEQAAALMQADGPPRKRRLRGHEIPLQDVKETAKKLQTLLSREAGETLLLNEAPGRRALETLARLLQLPVQRDDSVDRLRAKIIENTIGSRLRSDAIQGKLA